MTLEAWVEPVDVSTRSGATSSTRATTTTTSKAPPTAARVRPAGGRSAAPTRRLSARRRWPPNTWSHLAATYDGATLRLYVNGVLVATPGGRPGAITTSTNPLQIGGDSIYGQYFRA